MVNWLRPRRNLRGFTIVEIMIVMAVAGVIMVVVLGAVPQAQRNQRNNSRKALAQRLMSSLENYNANNQGSYPFVGVNGTWVSCNNQSGGGGNCGDWFSQYVSNEKIKISDPSSGNNIAINYSNSTANPTPSQWTPGNVYIGVGDVCSSASLAAGQSLGSATSKQFAMVVELENTGAWYCTDNR